MSVDRHTAYPSTHWHPRSSAAAQRTVPAAGPEGSLTGHEYAGCVTRTPTLHQPLRMGCRAHITRSEEQSEREMDKYKKKWSRTTSTAEEKMSWCSVTQLLGQNTQKNSTCGGGKCFKHVGSHEMGTRASKTNRIRERAVGRERSNLGRCITRPEHGLATNRHVPVQKNTPA